MSDSKESGNLAQLIEKNSTELHIPPETYTAIVKISFDQSRQDIVDLENAIAENNYEEIKAVSHRLKGVYSNLRLDDLFISVQEIDVLAKENGNLGKIKQLLSQFKMAFDDIIIKFQ